MVISSWIRVVTGSEVGVQAAKAVASPSVYIKDFITVILTKITELKHCTFFTMKYLLPWGLIVSRVLMAPLIIYLATLSHSWIGPIVVALMWFALIGDILDGIIARQFGIATPLMRRADSIADLIFWIAVGAALWVWRPEVFRPYLFWIRLALLLEALTYALSFVKFRRELAAHAYSGKLLGIGILLGFTNLWWTGSSSWAIGLMLTLAYLSHLDRFGIAFFLPRWTPDTPSMYHAWRIRQGLPIKKHKLFHGD